MPNDPLATLRARLAGRHITLVSVDADEGAAGLRIRGEVWRAISIPGFAALHDIYVALPIEGLVRSEGTGPLDIDALSQPTDDDVAEAQAYVTSLAEHGQIEGVVANDAEYSDGHPAAPQPARLTARPTHRLEADSQGRRRLVRIGFSGV